MFNLFRKRPKNFENVNAEKFITLMEKQNHVVLDVRTPAEVVEGFIPGSKAINFFDSDFHNQLQKLDKSKAYLVYCRSGARSRKACFIMSDMGFTTIYNLQGGIGAWNRIQIV